MSNETENQKIYLAVLNQLISSAKEELVELARDWCSAEKAEAEIKGEGMQRMNDILSWLTEQKKVAEGNPSAKPPTKPEK